jgi:hypothetical protein
MIDDQKAEPETAESNTAGSDTAESTTAGPQHPAPPHPPAARSSDEYTDPPGHHRRGPHGPALDVGA